MEEEEEEEEEEEDYTHGQMSFAGNSHVVILFVHISSSKYICTFLL